MDSFYMGTFSWTLLLDSGVGLIVGTYKGYKTGTFTFIQDFDGHNKKLCARYNDGFYTDAEKAKMMAYLTRVYVANQKFINKEFEKMMSDQKEQNQKFGYNWVRDDFLECYLRFAEWAEKSKGFWVR